MHTTHEDPEPLQQYIMTRIKANRTKTAATVMAMMTPETSDQTGDGLTTFKAIAIHENHIVVNSEAVGLSTNPTF